MAKKKANIFNGKEYEVRDSISIAEKGSIVVDIADAVFNDGVYAPYMLDVAYKLNCVMYYTNAEFPTFKNDDGEDVVDTDMAYELVNKSNIMEVLDGVIDHDIYENAYELIEYKKNAYLKNTGVGAFMDALTGLVKSLDNAVVKGLDGINASELLDAAKSISEKNEGDIAQGVLSFQEAKAKKNS